MKIIIIFMLLVTQLFCLQHCFADNQTKIYPDFEIIPNKSFGKIQFGDTQQVVKQYIDPIAKKFDLCSCFSSSQGGLCEKDLKYNCIVPSSTFLKTKYTHAEGVNYITWYGFCPFNLKYNDFKLIGQKTNLTEIKKLFPGGKIKDLSRERIELFYNVPQQGLKFYFEPISQLFWGEEMQDEVKKNFKYHYCFTQPDGLKYYNCYVLTEFHMSKINNK